jgi:hypothetical protein
MRERVRERGRYIPSGLIEELEVALASMVMLTQSSDGEEVTMETSGGTSRRWQCNPRILSLWPPTSSYMHCATGAHQPDTGWASPIRTRDQGPHLAVWAKHGGDQTNRIALAIRRQALVFAGRFLHLLMKPYGLVDSTNSSKTSGELLFITAHQE